MRRRPALRDDSGATLVMALIFITVVALVVTAVLALADASMRNTVAVRDQAADSATADGAAKVAINALRSGTYNTATGGNCFTVGTSLTVPNVSQATGKAPDSAVVTCAPDSTTSAVSTGVAINSQNKPGSAILALTTSPAEHGLDIKVSGNGTLKVKGRVAVKQDINVQQGTLQVDGGVVSHACVGSITSTPAAICNAASSDSRFDDPNYPVPTAPATPRTVPACPGNGKVVTFSPGLYDSADINDLNNLTKSNGCKDAIFYFTHGTYYFDFPQNKPWVINTGYVVGGTATLTDGVAPTIPGACASPIPPSVHPETWVKPGPDAGVQLVFGGTSQIQVQAAQFEVCGTYSTTSPPIAVYGLKQAANGVPAQSGCVITPADCPTILTDNSPNSRFYIQGTTYLPWGSVDVSLNNNTGQVFRFGIIARAIALNPTGSAFLGDPVIEVPDDSPAGIIRTVVQLVVYVCPRSATCTTGTGAQRLRVRVGLADPTGTTVAGAREVTVYSWSVLR
jgi:Tfp pilus assembly protein PilX